MYQSLHPDYVLAEIRERHARLRRHAEQARLLRDSQDRHRHRGRYRHRHRRRER